MKAQIHVLIGIFMLSFSSFSQEISEEIKNADSINIAYQQKMEDMFAHVDLTQATTGFLFDRGFSFIDLVPFDGQITEASKANSIIFGLGYAALTTMTIDEDKALPPPSSYRNRMDTINSESPIVLVGGMHYLYNMIDSTAVDDSLFSVVEDNLYDVFPRDRSPYLEKEFFLFAPAQIQMDQTHFKLRFDTDLFYSNTEKIIDSLKVDLGIGLGYQAIGFDEDIQMVFASAGRKTIKVKVVYTDASVYSSHFDLIIRKNAFRGVESPPDYTHHIDRIDTAEPDGGRGGGTIYTYLACGHTQIEKPFIWAEAYNPMVGKVKANLTKEEILLRLNHIDGAVGERRLLEHLEDNGYDIIILDYDNGADYLPRTSEFIKEALRWINQEKHHAGSNAENILLGQSMGGVCSMQALREMENDGENHEVEQYIIFDSPINGVNIPMSAQASLLDMSFMWVNKPLSDDDRFLYEYVGMIEDVLNLLYLPATRTMITKQCKTAKLNVSETRLDLMVESEAGIETEHLFPDYYDYLHNEMGGMPEQCEVLAITNGSRQTTDQGFEDGDLIVHANANHLVIGSIVAGLLEESIEDEDLDIFDSETMLGAYSFLAWAVGDGLSSITIDIRFYAMKRSTDFRYYYSYIEYSPWWTGAAVVSHINIARETDGLPVDHISGGFFGNKNQGVFLDGPMAAVVPVFRLNTWCFTPTASVLNYKYVLDGDLYTWIETPEIDFSDSEASLLSGTIRGIDNYVSNSLRPVFPSDPEARDFDNTAHTWFTEENSRFLIYHLIGSNELSADMSLMTGGTSYNYGKTAILPRTDFNTSLPIKTQPYLEHSILINSTTFNVNADEQIGLSPSPYGPDELGNALDNSHFIMFLGPTCEPTPKVTLELSTAAIMEVGDGTNRSGSVIVNDGHEIVVRANGKLHIKQNSTVKLRAGATLILEGNSEVIIEDGGQLITEYGSTIIFHENASVKLNGNGAKIILGGELHLQENAHFFPTHEGYSSGQVIIKNPDGTLVADSGSKFIIMGDSPSDPMLVINNHAKLIASAEMESMLFSNCNVIFRSDAEYAIQSFCPFTSAGVKYTVQSILSAENIHAKIGLYNKSFLSSSHFKDVLLHTEDIALAEGVVIRVNNSSFTSTYKIEDTQCNIEGGNLYIHNCSFNNYGTISLRLYGLTSFSRISNTDFDGAFSNPGYAIFTESETELLIKNCTFEHGDIGLYQNFGQSTLKCNEFSNISKYPIFAGFHSEIEMSAMFHAGYNTFLDPGEHNIKTDRAHSLRITHGYNYFKEDGTSTPTIYGTIETTIPSSLVPNGKKNQWNTANTVPSESEMKLYNSFSGDRIYYLLEDTESANCGLFDPSLPPVLTEGGSGSSSFASIPITGRDGLVRLDSAFSFAIESTTSWDDSADDLIGITRFYDILKYDYSERELADSLTMYYLDLAYSGMKSTIGRAISDSTILKSNNENVFDVNIQKYVDILNSFSGVDTIQKEEYVKLFYIELDKAHLFRQLGHTTMGLEIMLNLNDCELDSNEQVALNHWLFVYEEEIVKQSIGQTAYGKDTVYTDIAKYYPPTNSQATEFYFGSIINSISSVSYRTCFGSSVPKTINTTDAYPFKIYPNPSKGQIRIEYEIPTESNSEIIIYSMDGKALYKKELKSGIHSENIDISFAQSGLYLYQLRIDNENIEMGRIVIVK